MVGLPVKQVITCNLVQVLYIIQSEVETLHDIHFSLSRLPYLSCLSAKVMVAEICLM